MAGAHSDIHFATAHLLKGLKTRTVSSGIVTSLLQASQLMLNLGSVIVLARLLTPQDFGLLAMVFSVMGFFRVFNEAGLSTATVQKEEITHAQVSNLFWTNVALGGMITLALAFSGPGGCLVLPGATAGCRHAGTLRDFHLDKFNSSAPGAAQTPDAFQSGRAYSDRLGCDRGFRRYSHGLARFWLLESGRNATIHTGSRTPDDMVGL